MTKTLSPQEELTAEFWRNQQQGVAENIETREHRLAAAEHAGTLAVTMHDKALQAHKEDMEHFVGEAAKHVDANHNAYVETAKHEAEAEGHTINL